MSIGRTLLIGAGGDVGSATVDALRAAGADVVATGRERDATDPDVVAALLDEVDPDLVVVAAGVRPHMVPIDEQTWETFSIHWEADVRIAFEVGRAALARPLRPGSTVLLVSSGAALRTEGSPLSGGYAGSKRMEMVLAAYLQRVADQRGLEVRFVAVMPQQLIAGTGIGEGAATAYGRPAGPLDAAGVARAIVEIATGEAHPDATQLGLTDLGLAPV